MISKKFLKMHSVTSDKDANSLYRFLLDQSEPFEVEFFSRLFTKVARWNPGEDADKVFLESYEEAFEETRIHGSIPADFGTPFAILHVVISNARKGVEFFKELSFFYRAMVSQCQFEAIASQAENSGVFS